MAPPSRSAPAAAPTSVPPPIASPANFGGLDIANILNSIAQQPTSSSAPANPNASSSASAAPSVLVLCFVSPYCDLMCYYQLDHR